MPATLTLLEIDKNLVQYRQVPETAVFRNALEEPFDVYGLYDLTTPLCRIPKALWDVSNDGVKAMAYCTAGGRIRFATDADKIHVAFRLPYPNTFPHMPLSGSSSIDAYCNGIFCGAVRDEFTKEMVPNTDALGTINLPGEGMKEVEIFLPLYNGIESISIGMEPCFRVEHGSKYALEKPVVFYGSSITQGGCSCRPSTCYTALAARRLNVDHINLGFSGSARGEVEMAEYIASLPMSVFVLDYDHNAPTAKHLWATHENFYRIIRKAQPDLPIIMMSMSDYTAGDLECDERLRCITTTYEHALADGDKLVRFIDGRTLFDGENRENCTVDGCHPNDLGFFRMANKVEPVLRELLHLEGKK